MKIWFPLVLLIVLWAVVLTLFLTPEVEGGHGADHAKFAAMKQGGSGLARHQSVLVAGWLFGALQVLLFVGLLAWSAALPARNASPSGVARPGFRWAAFALGGLFYEGLLVRLFVDYRNSLEHPAAAEFLGSFPAATAWLVFGIWLAPVFFVALYVAFFDHWIFSPGQLRKFEALVAEHADARRSATEEV